MRFEAISKNSERWRWRDVRWQTVPKAASGHRKRTIIVGNVEDDVDVVAFFPELFGVRLCEQMVSYLLLSFSVAMWQMEMYTCALLVCLFFCSISYFTRQQGLEGSKLCWLPANAGCPVECS